MRVFSSCWMSEFQWNHLGGPDHIWTLSSCTGLPMKVESTNEVPMTPRVELPTASPAAKPEPGQGVDDLSLHFSQEVESSSRTLDKRVIDVRVPPVQVLAQLYEQLGHPAQESFAAVTHATQHRYIAGAHWR